jgi:hypothetical protein
MKTSLLEWLKLPDQNKRNIFAETAAKKALPISSIEKDWWVDREKFSHLGGVDYTKHAHKYIRIVPPENLLPLWEKDYNNMTISMVYGKKLSFNELIMRISDIQKVINKI